MLLPIDLGAIANLGIFALLAWHTRQVQYLCERVAVHESILFDQKKGG